MLKKNLRVTKTLQISLILKKKIQHKLDRYYHRLCDVIPCAQLHCTWERFNAYVTTSRDCTTSLMIIYGDQLYITHKYHRHIIVCVFGCLFSRQSTCITRKGNRLHNTSCMYLMHLLLINDLSLNYFINIVLYFSYVNTLSPGL